MDASNLNRPRRVRKGNDLVDYRESSTPPPSVKSQRSRGTSTSTDGGSVRLTKTGRVSKALKGQPVHKCTMCDKFYTRAEHLRRHKQNHSSQPSWLCDVPGCEKSQPGRGFFREDLLLRHKEDHENARRRSVAVSQPELPSGDPIFFDSMMRGAQGSGFESSYGPMPSPYLPAASQPMMASSIPESSYNASPFQPMMQGHMGMGDQQWHSSMNTSRSLSPASFSLSPFPMHQSWSTFEPDPVFDMVSTASSLSDGTAPTSVSSPMLHDLSVFENSCAEVPSLIESGEQDMARVEGDVAHFSVLTSDPVSHGAFWLLEDRYMPYFWAKFYPSFPVVHPSSLSAEMQPPALLRILLVALGASFAQTEDARIVTAGLADTADSLLRSQGLSDAAGILLKGFGTALSKVVDLQIAFLAEILSLYRSGAKVHKLSPRLETLFAMLQLEPALSPFDKQGDLALCNSTTALVGAHLAWIEAETKRRLQLACHILEAQHSWSLDQQREITYADMRLPCPASLWECQDPWEWKVQMEQQNFPERHLYDVLDNPAAIEHDEFTSAVVVALTTSAGPALQTSSLQLLQPPTGNARSEIIFHSIRLAVHTPVKDLLALTEGPILGQDTTAIEVEKSKRVVKQWTQTESVGKAMFHAVHILRTSFSSGASDVIHEEWALYLAALVCYATGMWSQRETAPSTVFPDLASRMNSFLARFDVNASDDVELRISDYAGTRACLEWTRRQLAGRERGLTYGASRVLEILAQ